MRSKNCLMHARRWIAALHKALAVPLIFALTAPPLHAREVDRQEIAEEFAEGVEQERRLYCRDTQLFTLTNGEEIRACIDWRAQNRTRLIRTYAALDGPDEDDDSNLNIARDCFDIAVASANDPYRESLDENLFLVAARTEFASCTTARNLQRDDTYSLRVYDTGVWVGGR